MCPFLGGEMRTLMSQNPRSLHFLLIDGRAEASFFSDAFEDCGVVPARHVRRQTGARASQKRIHDSHGE